MPIHSQKPPTFISTPHSLLRGIERTLLAITIAFIPVAVAAPVTLTNPGFEDTSGQSIFNEFTFGTPAGWSLYDPMGIISDPTVFTGTLQPNGVDFFNSTAAEGDRVSILFNSGREGDGEYGYTQALGATLEVDSSYTLTVEVGNITSGTDQSGTFYDLSEFPGYRVELLAGGTVIGEDNNTLTIAEGEFNLSSVVVDIGSTHAQLGLPLGVRLINLNAIPLGHTQATSPDLEVDFDDVRLSVVAIPEPHSVAFLALFVLFASTTKIRLRGKS